MLISSTSKIIKHQQHIILNFKYAKSLRSSTPKKLPCPNVSCPPSTFILLISCQFKCMMFHPTSQIRCDISWKLSACLTAPKKKLSQIRDWIWHDWIWLDIIGSISGSSNIFQPFLDLPTPIFFGIPQGVTQLEPPQRSAPPLLSGDSPWVPPSPESHPTWWRSARYVAPNNPKRIWMMWLQFFGMISNNNQHCL